VLRSPPWLGWPLWNICVTNDHGYVPLVANTSRIFPPPWLITGFVIRLTWRLPLQGRLSSPQFLVGFVLPDLPIYVYNVWIVVCPFVLCLWPLCGLFFFELRILITPLVFSNYAYTVKVINNTYKFLKPKLNLDDRPILFILLKLKCCRFGIQSLLSWFMWYIDY
jgi:hypothetical protein